jgi:hypothetical protein
VAVDTLIFLGWLSLGGLLLWRHARVGGAGWARWQRLMESPDQRDAALVRGLLVLPGVAAQGAALHDADLQARIESLALFAHERLGDDLEARLRAWRQDAQLLSLVREVRPLVERGLRARPLRVLAAAEVSLSAWPGRCAPLLRFRRHLALLGLAVRLSRHEADRARHDAGDRARLEQAALEAHEVLRDARQARLEQLRGARH